MKKIIQMLLIACMVVLGTQVAFANADKVTVQEGADLTAIHRLAIGSPLYMQVDPKSPNKDMLTQIVYESSRVARCYVISYDTVAQNIKADQNIDIKALDRRTAAKDFKQYVANYADAYVILTVANDSRTTFFFDVYSDMMLLEQLFRSSTRLQSIQQRQLQILSGTIMRLLSHTATDRRWA